MNHTTHIDRIKPAPHQTGLDVASPHLTNASPALINPVHGRLIVGRQPTPRSLTSRPQRFGPPLPTEPRAAANVFWAALFLLLLFVPTTGRAVEVTRQLGAGWQLLSLPIAPGNAAAALPADLQAEAYVAGNYVDRTDSAFPAATPGRAYWVNTPAPRLITITGEFLPINANREIVLTKGWNFIGTPWPQPLAWNDTRVSLRRAGDTRPLTDAIQQGWLRPDLHHFRPGSRDEYDLVSPNSGTLAPWQGYLLFLETDNAALVLTPPVSISGAPTAQITSPLDGANVSEPTDVSGLIAGDLVDRWTLAFRSHEAVSAGTPWTVFASGHGPVALAQQLGTFDTTLLLNGIYDLRLEAHDAYGRSAAAIQPIVVFGFLKLGHLEAHSLEFSVPVPGGPIDVVRIYDSRLKRAGDFGPGTTLNLDYVRLQKTRRLGADWYHYSDVGRLPVPYYKLEPHPPARRNDKPQPRYVTITFPRDVVYRFEAKPRPSVQGAFPITAGTMSFQPLPGTYGTLLPLDSSNQLEEEFLVDPTLGFLDLQFSDGRDVYDPKRFLLRLPDNSSYIVDEIAGVLKFTDANGNTVERTPTGIRHSNGNVVAFARDAANRITSITDLEGNATGYRYDNDGKLVEAIDREGNVTSYEWLQGTTLLVDIQDPRSVNPTHNEWDGLERFQSYVNALLQGKTFSYQLDNRVQTVVDERGNATVQTMDFLGNIISLEDAAGNVTSYRYDDAKHPFLPTRITNPDGGRTELTYNARGQIVTRRDPLGAVTRSDFDSAGNLTRITDPLGNQTSYTYDSRRNLTSTTNAVGAVSTFEYDANGTLVAEVGALGHRTAYTNNSAGLPTLVLDYAPDGELKNRREFAYDSMGRVTRMGRQRTGPGGVEMLITEATYDSNGGLTELRLPDGGEISRTFNAAGLVETQTNAGGKTSLHEYDPIGRPSRITYFDQSFETWQYDPAGNAIAFQDRNGWVWNSEFDGNNRPLREYQPDGRFTEYEYDSNGRVVSIIDPAGRTYNRVYDAAGNLTEESFPDGSVVRRNYDPAGNLLTETQRAIPPQVASAGSSLGQLGLPGTLPATAYHYDGIHRLTTVTSPRGNDTFTYDHLNRLTKLTDRLGREREYKYDFGYGGAAFRTEVIDDLGTLELMSYNEVGDTITVTTESGAPCVQTNGYDGNGRLTSTAYPDGTTSSTSYDEEGRPVESFDRLGVRTTYSYGSGSGCSERVTTTLHMTDADAISTSKCYDPMGNMVEQVDAEGNVTAYTYDFFNRMTSVRDSIGTLRTITYGPNSRVESVTDARGHTTTFTYDENDFVTGTTYPDLSTTAARYDVLGRPQWVEDQHGERTTFVWEGDGSQVTITDRTGAVTVRAYDAGERLTSLTRHTGQGSNQVTSWTYDQRDRITRVQYPYYNHTYVHTPDGRQTTFTNGRGLITMTKVNCDGHPTLINYPDETSEAFFPDAYGNILQHINQADEVSHFQYDDRQLLIESEQVGESGSKITRRTYTTRGLPHTVSTVVEGTTLRTTAMENYDVRGRVGRVVSPGDRVDLYSYDDNGNVISHTNPRGFVTTTAYDPMNRPTETVHPKPPTFPSGPTQFKTSVKYYATGWPMSQTDLAGFTTDFEYDKEGRPTRVLSPEGIVDTMVYDAVGNVITTIDAETRSTAREYDLMNRLTAVVSPINCRTTYAYDENDNTTQVTLWDGRSSASTYDELDRPTLVTFPDGTSQSTTYDALGRPTLVSGPGTHRVATHYDAFGRPTEIRRGSPALTTRYRYNLADDLLALTDPLGRETAFSYNASGELTRRVFPPENGEPAELESFVRDAHGNVIQRTDPLGQVFDYTYDNLDRLVRRTRGSITLETHEYDPRGLRTRTVDSTGVTIQRYDGAGRLHFRQTPQGSLEYIHDRVGNLLSVRSANRGGTHVEYTYDELDRIASVQDRNTDRMTTYDRGCAGAVESFTGPSGIAVSTSFDALNRLARRTATAPGESLTWDYTRDALGFPTAASEPRRQVHFEYDAQQRLTAEAVSNEPNGLNGRVDYSLDAANNRLSRLSTLPPVPPVPGPIAYDSRDRQTGNSYDANGNLLSEGARAFEWDETNRLLSANNGAVAYRHSGTGSRIEKAVPNQSQVIRRTRFVVDEANPSGLPQVLEETDEDGIVLTNHLWGEQVLATGRRRWGQPAVPGMLAVDDSTSEPATPAIDADLGTAWRTADPGRWLRVDLGTTVHLAGIALDATLAYSPAPEPTAPAELNQITLGAFQPTCDIQAVTIDFGGPAGAQYVFSIETTTNGTNWILRLEDAVGLADAGPAVYTLESAPGQCPITAVRLVSEGPLPVDSIDIGTAFNATVGGSARFGNQTSGGAPTGGLGLVVETSLDGNDWTPQTVADPLSYPTFSTLTLPGVPARYVRLRSDRASTITPFSVREIAPIPVGAPSEALTPEHWIADDWFAYGYDGLGTVRYLSDGDGAITDTFDFDAYGNLLARTGATSDVPYLFMGERFDAETGTYHLRAREYDPASGRFLSEDPAPEFLDDPAGHNPFVYANANPAAFHDPTGLFAWTIPGIMLDYELFRSHRANVENGYAQDNGVHSRVYSTGGGWGAFMTFLEREREPASRQAWIGGQEGQIVGGLVGHSISGGGAASEMLFRAYSGAGVSSKAVRDAETIHQIAVGLEKGRNVDGPGWVEELFGGKANHTLLARNDLGRHRDRLNFMVTNDLISGMFKGLSIGADPFRDEYRVDAYAARSGRGPGVSRNDFSAGAKTMRLIRPNTAGNPDVGFSAWRSPLSPDEKEEYLRTEEIIGRRDAMEFITMQIGWLASDLWSGSINDVQYLAYEVGGVDDYEEDIEYTDSSLEPYATDLSANCFAEGTPVLLGDGSSVAIDALPLGSRVQTALPGEAQSSDSTVDRETHRLVTLELPAAEGGGLLTIERIISAEELRGTPVGGRIYIQLDEHQLFGYAKVLSLEPCPALAEGPGRLVVARFRQVSPEVLDLWLEGAAAPLTVTASHPLWSVEEASYLQASRLAVGTHLLRHDGSTVRITQITRRHEPTPVLNISVESDARYFAGVEGVLGHNSKLRAGKALFGSAAKVAGAGASGAKASKLAKAARAVGKGGKSASKVNLNSNRAVSRFGVYEIEIGGVLHKVGKADLNRITKSRGLPTRIHQQVIKLEKMHSGAEVEPRIVERLGLTSTAVAKAAERTRLLQIHDRTGLIPPGNRKSFKP